ncbi:hypothetical protein [Thiomicrorhabdus arctica]|uniref:hypothetical protein n=1 Tax=Thiomicrorhabdus arctica TaxID=131540 RepID=UPI0003657B6A|nr:hypothetical protein [Thiomicrorhabdus arctica]
MQLIENNYENALLLKLPPNARDIAEHFLTFKPLHELLIMWQENKPDLNLLSEHRVAEQHWEGILKATLLAKTTYFFQNANFNEDEVLYLLKIACASADLPLKAYNLAEVMDLSKDEMPVFHLWLKHYTQRLKTAHQRRASAIY